MAKVLAEYDSWTDASLWRSEEALYLLLIYFIGSAVGIIAGLMRINKYLKAHDRL